MKTDFVVERDGYLPAVVWDALKYGCLDFSVDLDAILEDSLECQLADCPRDDDYVSHGVPAAIIVESVTVVCNAKTGWKTVGFWSCREIVRGSVAEALRDTDPDRC